MDCLDEAEFEKYRIIYLLDLIIEHDGLWKNAVNDLYHESIESYDFLIVFSFLDDMVNHDETAYGINPNSMDDLYSSSKAEAIKMKNWLNSETIIIKGRAGHRKGTNFIDNRNENEK
jgi:hypothetical protein